MKDKEEMKRTIDYLLVTVVQHRSIVLIHQTILNTVAPDFSELLNAAGISKYHGENNRPQNRTRIGYRSAEAELGESSSLDGAD